VIDIDDAAMLDMLLNAVEVALHDAWARSLGVGISALLGGLVRTSVPVTWALGTDPAPAVTWGSELFGPLLMRDELLRSPLRYENGELHLPDGPGLGVEVATDTLRAMARK
jgi:L-alanine-DL-glutamate epimerase-like enolase superfamily enzyme